MTHNNAPTHHFIKGIFTHFSLILFLVGLQGTQLFSQLA